MAKEMQLVMQSKIKIDD